MQPTNKQHIKTEFLLRLTDSDFDINTFKAIDVKLRPLVKKALNPDTKSDTLNYSLIDKEINRERYSRKSSNFINSILLGIMNLFRLRDSSKQLHHAYENLVKMKEKLEKDFVQQLCEDQDDISLPKETLALLKKHTNSNTIDLSNDKYINLYSKCIDRDSSFILFLNKIMIPENSNMTPIFNSIIESALRETNLEISDNLKNNTLFITLAKKNGIPEERLEIKSPHDKKEYNKGRKNFLKDTLEKHTAFTKRSGSLSKIERNIYEHTLSNILFNREDHSLLPDRSFPKFGMTKDKLEEINSEVKNGAKYIHDKEFQKLLISYVKPTPTQQLPFMGIDAILFNQHGVTHPSFYFLYFDLFEGIYTGGQVFDDFCETSGEALIRFAANYPELATLNGKTEKIHEALIKIINNKNFQYQGSNTPETKEHLIAALDTSFKIWENEQKILAARRTDIS